MISQDMTTEQMIARVYAAVDRLMDEEAQDQVLVAEMAQQMLFGILHGQMNDTVVYVRRYCTILDGPDEAAALAAEIDQIAREMAP